MLEEETMEWSDIKLVPCEMILRETTLSVLKNNIVWLSFLISDMVNNTNFVFGNENHFQSFSSANPSLDH